MSVYRGMSFRQIVRQQGSERAAVQYLADELGMDLYAIEKLAKIPLFVVFLYRQGVRLTSRLLFEDFVDFYDRLARARKRRMRISQLARFFAYLQEKDRDGDLPIEKAVGFIVGYFGQTSYGYSNQFSSRAKNAIALAYGVSADTVENRWKYSGDYADVAAELCKESHDRTPRQPFFLTAEVVFEFFHHLSRDVSVKLRNDLLASLLKLATPDETHYLMQIVMRDLRTLKTETTLVAASQAFKLDLQLLNYAYQRVGLTRALIAGIKRGNAGLQAIKLKPLMMVSPQLASATTFDDLVDKNYAPPLYVETKYDGMRGIFHKAATGEVLIQSRRFVDLTANFPELAELVRTELTGDSFILDGEIVAFKPKNPATGEEGGLLAWKHLMRRVKAYDKVTRQKIHDQELYPVTVRFFDVIYLNGRDLTELPLEDRRELLHQVVPARYLARSKKCWSYDDLRHTFELTLEHGLEGLLVKFLQGKYVLRDRTRNWLKLKRERETLDVVVLRAQYGRRGSDFLRSFFVGVRDETSARYVPVCSVSNVNENLAMELTALVEKHVVQELPFGKVVRPAIVLEIQFIEVHASKDKKTLPQQTFPGWNLDETPPYALRNPYVIRIRYDKSVEDINSIQDLERAYQDQQRRMERKKGRLMDEHLD